MHVEVFRAYTLVADFDIDVEAKTVSNYQKYTNDWMYWPFTLKDVTTYDMFIGFLERRCPDRDCWNIKEVLRNMGLTAFDPIAIVKTTHGIMLDDFLWVRFDYEDIDYDKIKIRRDLPKSV